MRPGWNHAMKTLSNANSVAFNGANIELSKQKRWLWQPTLTYCNIMQNLDCVQNDINVI